MFSFPLIPHTPTDTKSKINYKNQKSTTKSTKKKKNQPQNQQQKKINHKISKKNQLLEQNRWIGGVDGNR